MKTDEIMKVLLDAARAEVKELRAALKERGAPPKAQPMSESDIQKLLVEIASIGDSDADIKIETEFDAVGFLVRLVERHHKITGE